MAHDVVAKDDVSRETSRDVVLPRPNHTTFALCLLRDSTPENERHYALEDVLAEVRKKWTPGNDLCMIIRQPTDSELLRMQAALDEESSNGN